MSAPLLSLCLIFRDEEAMLPGFLEAVDGLWDELIAVDTGSVDRSAKMLADAGARVVEFPWCDDFAAARNASLQPAAGQWILFLDADERPSAELAKEIRTLITRDEVGAATVVMRNQMPGGHRRDSRLLRLFRNSPDIRFRYRIHEDVSSDVQDFLARENLQLVHLDGVVEHLGYVREVAADRNKKDRDLTLLRMSLEQDPDDFYCRFKILEIARFWEDRELWHQESVQCLARFEQLAPLQIEDLKGRQWSGELAVMVVQGGDLEPEQQLTWLDAQMAWVKESAAWWLYRGSLLEALGDLAAAEKEYHKCLEQTGEASTQLKGVRPLLGLCRLALARGQAREAEDLAIQAGNLAPQDEEALLVLAACSHLDPEQSPLKKHLEDHPASRVAAGRVLLGHGQSGGAAKVLGLVTGNAEAALGLLVSNLACGGDFQGDIDTDQETADRLLKGWITLLWDSRDTGAMTAFAEGCAALTGTFPWLPAFLEAETKRLREQTP